VQVAQSAFFWSDGWISGIIHQANISWSGYCTLQIVLEAGFVASKFFVGNAQPTIKKFCSDPFPQSPNHQTNESSIPFPNRRINESPNQPLPRRRTNGQKRMEKWALYKIIKTAYY
jgi:hypothetical protein